MIFELWSDNTYMPRCPSDGHLERCAHRLIDESAKLVWAYNAKSSNDASQALHEHLGYGPYKPMLQPDGTNYPEDDALFDDAIDDIIDEWHNGMYPGRELHEALGWTWDEYSAWVSDGTKVPGR